GGLAAGASIGYAIATGDVETSVGNNAQIGQNVLKTVGDLLLNTSLTSHAYLFVLAVGLASGAAGAGSDAKADLKKHLIAKLGDVDVKVGGNVELRSISDMKAEAISVGAVLSGSLSVGVALAKAYITPELDTFIGANATVVAGSNIVLEARHNMDAAGANLDRVAETLGVAGAGSLGLSGGGTETKSYANPTLDAYTADGARLQAAGNITMKSQAYNKAISKSYAVSFGAISISGIKAESKTNANVSAYVLGDITDSAGTGSGAANLTLTAKSVSNSTTYGLAVSVSGLGASGVDADAFASPTAKAYIAGGDVRVTNNVVIDAITETNADTEGLGIAVGGLAIGVSLPDAETNPTLKTSIGCIPDGACSTTSVTTTSGNISMRALNNMTTAGVLINNGAGSPNGAYSYGNPSGGGALSGNGADVDASANVTIDNQVSSNATLTAGGSIAIQSFSSAYADAKGYGVVIGGVTVGAILTDANANGNIKARMEGTVASGTNLTVETYAINTADTSENLVAAGGIISGNGLDMDANANPTINTYISGNVNSVSGNILVRTRSEGNAKVDGKGITVGVGISIGATLGDATVSPTINTYSSGSTVTTTAGTIIIQTLHNFTTAGAIIQNGAGIPKGAYAYGVASGGGVLAGNGVDLDATASPTINTYSAGTLRAGGAISLITRSSQKAYGEAEAATGGGVAIGVVLVDADANGTIKSYINGDITLGTTVALETYVVADAESPDNTAPTGGLIAANGVNADTHANPTIKTYIDDSSSLTNLSGTVSLTSRSEGAAYTSAETAVGGGIALGNILTDAYVSPIVESYIGTSAVVSTSGGITVAAYHNYWNSAIVDKRAYAYAEASGGGIIGVNIAHGVADAKANVSSFAKSGSVLDAGGNIKIEAISHNKTYAESNGVSGGAVGVGESKANATSNGTTQAYLNGSVRDKDVATNPGAHDVKINASTFDDAHATSSATSGGVVAGSGSYAPAHAYSTTKAYTANSISIILLGDLTISALGTPKTYSSAVGYGGGAISVGVSEAEAYSSVTVLAWLGQSVNVIGGVRVLNGGTLTFENYADQTEVLAVMSGTPNLTFSNGGSGGRATIARSSGSYITDGFAANQTIYITNSSGVTNSYVIYSLSATTLTLTTTASFSGTVVSGASMKGTIPSSLTIDATMSGTPTIDFANGGQAVPDTIKRNSGNWISDGFQAGQDIQVLGAGNTNSGIYKIDSLTANTLTLQQTNSLSAALAVSGVSVLAFHATPDSIARTTGSWLTDGFLANDIIRVSGTADNDGNYTITGISATKVSLDTVGAFTDATLSSGVSITLFDRPSTTNDGGNVTISAGQALPASGHSAYSYANNAGGGIISINATDSEARRESDSDNNNMTRAINAHIDHNATLDVIGTITVSVGSQTDQKAVTTGKSGGVLAVGSNPANASSTSEAYAYLGNDVKITATKLVISADGKDTNFADSTAGTGGIVSVAAADSEVDDNAKVTASLGSTSSAARKIVVDTLELKAVHLSTFNSTADGFAVSLIGYGGAISTNNINPQVRAEFNGTWVEAANISLTATSEHKKDWLAGGVDNATTIGGGLVDAPASKSTTTITGTTGIFINDNTKLTQTGETFSAGTFEGFVYNKIFAMDRVSIDSGGALPFPRVRSEVKTSSYFGLIEIGDADIVAVGDLTFSIRTQADIETRANGKAYGIAGQPLGDAISTVVVTNKILVKNGASILSGGNVNFLAGRTILYNGNLYKLDAYTDLYNWTLFPLLESSLDADSTVNQTNLVQIDNGASLEMVGNATFSAYTGTVIVYGQGRGHDLYREAGEAVFGDGVSFAIENGSATDTHNNGVIVNGTVRVGTQNKLAMTLSGTTAAPVITADAGITYTYTKESLVLNLQADQARLQQLKQQYKGTDAADAFNAQLALIEQQLDDLGFCSPQFNNGVDASGGTTTVCETDIPVYYVTVNDIKAQSSNIVVEADYFEASGNTGKLYAPGDAEITITNSGPFSLRFNRVVIPDATGGRIIYNKEALVGANSSALQAAINARNPVGHQAADFHTIQSSADSNPPTIRITSTYAAAGNETDPDIEFIGDVFAPSRFAQGVIYVENVNGSIYVKNVAGSTSVNIEAFMVTLKAGKNFVQEYKPGFTNIGGQPEGHWASVANSSEAYKCDRSNVCSAIAALDDSSPKGGSGENYIAGNIVLISGEYLNINGTVQSGLADRTLTLNASDQSTIDSYRSSYNLLKSWGYSPSETIALRQSVEFTVHYNAASDRIEVSNVVVQGGYMELYGLIMSTGNGNIKVLDGYGRIVINNQTNKNLFINKLDTGSGTEGELIITDTAKPKVTRIVTSVGSVTKNLATRYTRMGNDIQIYTNTAYDNGATPGNDESFDWVQGSTVSGTRTTSYTPVSGLAYTWVTGQRKVDRYWYQFETSSWLGVDAFSRDPGAASNSSTENIDATTLSEGAYVDPTSPASGEYSYSYQRLVISTPADCAASGGIYQSGGAYVGKCQIDERHTSRSSGFLGLGRTYTDQYWFEQTYKDIHTHSVSADNTITITFIGFDSGTLNVTSSSGIVIGADINNPSGTTSLTANNGSITVESEAVTLESNSLNLSATSGIGSPGRPLVLDVGTGVLNATTTSGSIYLTELSNNLLVNQITTGNGDVVLRLQQDLIPLNTAALIQGGRIEIYSDLGGVGTSSALPMRINVGDDNLHDYLLVEATGNVYLEEISGDLRLKYIRTNLDVWVKVTSGSLLDRRSGFTEDKRQLADLVELWDSLNLRAADGANAQPAIDAHVAMINNDYQTYLYYRVNGTNVSATLEASMLAAGYTAADVALQNTKRADEYAALQGRFDLIGNVLFDTFDAGLVDDAADTVAMPGHSYTTGDVVMYDADGGTVIPGLANGQKYSVTVIDPNTIQLSPVGSSVVQDITAPVSGTQIFRDAGWDYKTDANFYEPTFDDGSNTIDAGAETITFANGHIFRDGTKVMYDANGGSVIPGLVDGKNYIVNVIDDHTIKLSLYKDGSNVIQDIAPLGAGTHLLSEVRAIASTTVWSDADVQYALTGGWLKTVSDTQTQQEDPNITGRSVTIITSAGVGQNNGVEVIDLTNLGNISDAQKAKLASTERVDAIIINPNNDTINFGYAHGKSNGDAISFPGTLGISSLSASVSDGVTYYVVKTDALAIQLATTQALALAGTSNVDLTVRKIYIVMKDDIDLEILQPLTSVLTVNAGSVAYIGSEQPVRIGTITTGDETRIKSAVSIIDAGSSAAPNVSITNGNLVLEAGSNNVGAPSAFIEVSMSNSASLTARAGDSVYVRGVSGVTDNLYLDTIYAVTKVELQGIHIYDSYNDDSSGGFLNIKTIDLLITTSGNIGTSANYVEMDLEASGHLTASSSGGDIYLGETLGSMNVDRVTALAGNVGLRAQSSIYDWNQDLAADVRADDVTLEAFLGEIGQLLGGSNDGNFEIDSDTAGAVGSGVLTTYSQDDLNLMETSGSLYLFQIETGYGTAFIISPASILNGNGGTCDSTSVAGCNIVTGVLTLPGKARLFAANDIGSDTITGISFGAITSNVGRVEGVAQNGCFYLTNQGALISGGVTSATTSIEANCIEVTAQSPVTVEVSQIAHTGDIVIISEDNGATDFVKVNPGITLQATAGTVWLRGGDS
ncbi:MAG: hypothetical protein H8D34_27645, partial [Chloroflexi bacterium]|nr:hypothetical protein [Chloroflexota bacterium]